MKYYYLSNEEKVGPLSIDELKESELNSETFVWYSGLEKWKKLKNLPELQKLLNENSETKYYILVNDNKEGPFYFEDIKNKDIQPSTLIWTKKLDSWTKAKDIEELEELIMPPIPEQQDDLNDDEAEDEENHNTNSTNKGTENQESYQQSPKYVNPKYVENTGTYFKRTLSHKGRIGRGEYFIVLVIAIACIRFLESLSDELFIGYYDSSTDYLIIFILLLDIFLIYVIVVNTAKRCHDVGNSGWYQLIPFYSLIILFIPGQKGDNEWGNSPKE